MALVIAQDMSRNQFRLLVVVNQLLMVTAALVQDVTDKYLPPEIKSYLGIDGSVLNPETVFEIDVLYWIGTGLLVTGFVASIGLFFGKRWGRSLFLLTFVAALATTPVRDVYISTGWSTFASYFAAITEGMILGLAYFSHVKRIFDNSEVM